ncbi:MAG TPA: signal peptidase II [Steroidobacteraceae bacterium]|nr:signal peptidase II [Steroidobacteraceae bacterium]
MSSTVESGVDITGDRRAQANGWRWLPLTLGVIVLDQATKLWMVQHFRLYETFKVLPVLDITLMFNTGAAFSFLSSSSGWQKWLFVALALLVSGAILVWLRRLRARSQALLCCSLTLILAGALGNVIDRLRIGHVVDFIAAHWGAAYFPAFNVADSAITCGAVLLLLDAWLESRSAKKVGV